MTLRATAVSLVAALSAIPAGAGEYDAATLDEYCRAKISQSAPLCDCLFRQFGKLTDGQQALLGAVLRNEDGSLPDLRAVLSTAEAEQVETFLARETLLCRPSG